jgi:MATE family multidrug resistance protein
MLTMTAYYIFGLPLGVLFAFKLQYGLHGMWISLTLALAYCAVIGTWLAVRTDWNREVQKVQDRLKEEDKRRTLCGNMFNEQTVVH